MNIYVSENPKNIEIQNFEPQKMTRAYVCMKISESPGELLPAKLDHFNVIKTMNSRLSPFNQ